MEGIILNFRGGRHTQYNNQMLVQVNGINTKEEAKTLIGKTVVWVSPSNKEIKGVIKSTHGSRGIVRVLFERGMPGQSITQKVKII